MVVVRSSIYANEFVTTNTYQYRALPGNLRTTYRGGSHASQTRRILINGGFVSPRVLLRIHVP